MQGSEERRRGGSAGAHGGTRSSPSRGGGAAATPPCPSGGLAGTLRPAPLSLQSFVCAAVSTVPKTQVPGPGPDAAHPFALVFFHNVWQTGGVQ